MNYIRVMGLIAFEIYKINLITQFIFTIILDYKT